MTQRQLRGGSSGRSTMAVWIGPVSSTPITPAFLIGQPGERLLASLRPPPIGTTFDVSGRRNALAVARPGFRQLATLGQQVAAAIGVLHVVADAVRQC